MLDVHGGRIEDYMEDTGLAETEIVDFSANINPLGPPRSVQAAIADALPSVRHYPDIHQRQVRRVLSERFQVGEECILCGNGASEVIDLFFRALRPARVHLVEPAFAEYARFARRSGADIHVLTAASELLAGRLEPVLKRLDAAVRPGDAVVLNNPHNPSGRFFFRSVWEPFVLDWAERGVWVLCDESFLDFRKDGDAHSAIHLSAQTRRLVTVRSATKVYAMPGLRFGFGVAHPDTVRRLEAGRDPWSVNRLAQAAAAAAYQDDSFLQETWRWLAEEQDFLAARWGREADWRWYAGDANFFLVRWNDASVEGLLVYLQRQGLFLRSCANFPGLGPNFLRIAVRSRPENERLWQAVTSYLHSSASRPAAVSLPHIPEPVPRRAKSLMLVGTASGVGKSVLTAALCRILHEDGVDVAPFKAQNMSLNSAVTPSGREIGRAQAVQAEACGIPPNEHMNPVLLKPTGPHQSQVVLQGRVYDSVTAREYFAGDKRELWNAVQESYAYLAERHQVVVIEGAGSPVEVNLKARDIANFKVAAMADADVLLVADIDRGGVFASIVGTLALLDADERARVKGILINRFRGDASLFREGVRWLEQRTGLPVVGVVPFIPRIGIDEEDSVALDSVRYQGGGPATDQHRIPDAHQLRIAIVRLPHIANFTDFDPLFLEPQVEAHFCTRPEELRGAAAVVLPGTKSTLLDLAWLHESGWAQALQSFAEAGGWVLGICGGFQMLGVHVLDPYGIEAGADEEPGLDLLPVSTEILPRKRTALVRAELMGPFAPLRVDGYEIHMGKTNWQSESVLPFARLEADTDGRARVDGCIAEDGRVIGTYLHGILHNDDFRHAWLRRLCQARGVPFYSVPLRAQAVREQALARLAEVVRNHVQLPRIYEWLGISSGFVS
ncbi:cobyric acid synthase [Alicyclobacillus kakegawensis]|uniref:cobyric acid synthase n=1 Tax=Alicyclobacillus kakegawensis TaxID=392012 RepID=UPI00082E60DA|nr:cobyric acid synthase [Alicyclobacillus kakegawensis]